MSATGRDEADSTENYELIVWSGPAAPDVTHRRTDRLGYRLRGEAEPSDLPRPEVAYRWVDRSALGDAATVTVVRGSTVDEVLLAFGADPAASVAARERLEALDIDPWVTVLDVGDAVLAVEFNRWRGSEAPVMSALSLRGRAASMYWSANAHTRLVVARGGDILANFEPGLEPVPADPEIQQLLRGLDLDDYRDRVGKGLAVVERFTGYRPRREDIDLILERDVGYPITE